MDNIIRNSFQRVKQDIAFLKSQIIQLKEQNSKNNINYIENQILKLKQEIDDLKTNFSQINNFIKDINNKLDQIIQNNQKSSEFRQTDRQLNSEAISTDTSTHNQTYLPNNSAISTDTSTHNAHFKPLKDQNLSISTGNQGVPADRQTDRQTDKQEDFSDIQTKINENSFDNAIEILNSLDSIKKELRLKFKRLTEQEFLVFSSLYQIEEEIGYADYKTIANKLNLTESSIRDYISRLIKKGVPVDKIKLNNKIIHLKISKNLKKIANLPTIMQLRDL